MILTLKTLCIAAMAALALSLSASSASAAEDSLTVAETPVELHADQTTIHIFKTNAGREVTCKNATFTGTLSGTLTEVSITPSYSECHTVLAGTTLSATVTMNGCTYLFTADPAGTTANASVDICPGGSSITIDIYAGATHKEGDATFCRLHLATPQAKTKVETENSSGFVLVTANVTGLEVTRTGNATCGTLNHTATYTGQSTLKATEWVTPVPIEVSQ